MAPGPLVGKRPRGQTGDLSRPSLNKRARRSESLDSDENSDHGNVSSAHSDATDEDNDERQIRATQRFTARMQGSRYARNQPAENGIIEEIKCTNFMCHEQLTVSLGPLINFIIGHNGSGKSAVLTALTLCLGGKPTATNRGQSLKSFIKEGKEFSILSVRIKNQGSSSYRHELYGDSIYVERHFSKTSSGFKLKDINGRIISNKKQELENILDHFALQIDNPMNVLTQDMARQFLNDSNPRDKYKFFLKGTQLQALDEDYGVIKEKLDETEAKIEVVKQDIEHLRTKAEAAVEKAKRAANLVKMRAKERLLLHQAAWARVEEEEKHLLSIQKEIEDMQRGIDERNAEVDRQSQEYEMANQAFSNANQECQDREADLIALEEGHNGIKEKFDDGKKTVVESMSSLRQIVCSIGNKESIVKEKEALIQQARQRQAEADNGEHAQKAQELEEAKIAFKEVKNEINAHETEKAGLQKMQRTAREENRTADEKANEKLLEVRRTETIKHDLEKGQFNWLDAYSNPKVLKKVLDAIQNERRFRERPVGPIGRHVKLLKPEWSSILEKSAGEFLNAFVVTSKADQNILTGILRRERYNCPIYIGSSRPIDTSGNEPEPGLDTWLRVLKFDNDLVRNQMIVNLMIDNIALIKDRRQAENFMHDGGDRRKNVRACLTMMDKNPQKGHNISLNPNTGTVSLGPITNWNGRPRMQADKESQVNAAAENLRRAKEEYAQAKSQCEELKRKATDCQGNLDNHGKRAKALLLQSQRAQAKMEALEDELSTATPIAGQIEELEKELQAAKDELEFDNDQHEDMNSELDSIKAKQKELLSSLNASQKNIDQKNVEIGKARTKAERMNAKREEALRNKNLAIEKASAAEKNKGEWQQQCGEQIVIKDDITEQALQICPRVEVPEGKTSEALQKKRQEVKQTREEAQANLGGSEDELLQAANEAKVRHHDAFKNLDRNRKVSVELARSLETRRQRWEHFRQYITTQSRTGFTYLLSERQFRGTLKVDHKKSALEIQVQPDITVQGAAGRQTKTLSGGEKSFSTICLLLSLWDAMGSPIRCLDEFDVFMDNVNRAQSMKMIIQAARRAVGRQFIFITPQAMNDVGHGDDVKIIRMRDPERGQTTLNIA